MTARDREILSHIHEIEAVTVTEMVERLHLPPNARRTMRGHLRRLVRDGVLRARPRDTASGRGGRVLFALTDAYKAERKRRIL